MPQIKTCMIMVLLTSTTGCINYDAKWQDGDYYLIAIDSESQMELVRAPAGTVDGIALVGPTVFAVGSNDKYIVLKAHPTIGNSDDFDRRRTQYFIVDRQKPIARQVMGPLKREDFDRLAKDARMPPFSKEFEDLK